MSPAVIIAFAAAAEAAFFMLMKSMSVLSMSKMIALIIIQIFSLVEHDGLVANSLEYVKVAHVKVTLCG